MAYNQEVVRQFAPATVFRDIIGVLDGIYSAAALYWPALNLNTS